MSDRAKGSWLTPVFPQLNRIGVQGLGDITSDTPEDLALPTEPFLEATTLKEVAKHGATGWGRLQVTDPPSADESNDSDSGSAKRAQDTFHDFVKNIGEDYGIELPLDDSDTDPKEFCHAFWSAVDRGRSPQVGIKHKPVKGQALDQQPEQMGFGCKKLKDYQLQDVGQATMIDRKMKCPLLLHDMGLGKTIQAIAICEINWGGLVLIVAPAMLADTWLKELHETVPGRKVYDYRLQAQEHKTRKEIECFDYVIVSYQMAEREFAKGQNFARHQELRMAGEEFEVIEPTERQMLQGGPDSKTKRIPLEKTLPSGPLHNIAWYRVVCDEAHALKGNGKTTTAVCALRRKRGMYLTGTPQQNGFKDWFAAFRFARVDPFSRDEAQFKEYFVNIRLSSVNDYGPLEERRARILSLIVRGISIRRRKEDRFNGQLPIPALKVTEHPIILVKPDNGTKYPHHPKTEKECQEALKHHWEQGGSGQAKKGVDAPKLQNHVLAEMTLARQATAHPAVSEAPTVNKNKTTNTAKVLAAYKNWLASFEQPSAEKRWRSSVIVAALKIIRDHAHAMRKGHSDSNGGVIVFCQFRPVLDLIGIGVREEISHGVGCIQFDGRLSKEERKENLERFKAQASLEDLVLLATPHTGGVGLNIPEASCIIILTPHFNPFVDEQAKARAVRPGQSQHVYIWTIAMTSSFDVRIGFVQGRKIQNAEDITEWDKNQRQAVKEAEGWQEKDFYKEIESIWVTAPRQHDSGDDSDVDSDAYHSLHSDSEYEPSSDDSE